MYRFQLKTLAYFLSFVLGGGVAGAAEIVIKQQAQVDGPILRLGDVAQIIGTEAEIAQLKAIEVAVSPATNASRRMTLSEIRELLIIRGLNPLQHRVQGSSVVEVRRPGPTYRYKTLTANTTPRQKNTQLKTDEEKTLVVVATRPLRTGDLIGQGDVQFESHSKRQMKKGMLLSADDAVGMEVVRSLSTGQPILDRDLRVPLLVRRKQRVTLSVRVGGVVIRTHAQAIQDGALHESIRVEKPNKTLLSAEVVGVQEVEIRAARPFDQPSEELRQAERERRERYFHPFLRARRQIPNQPSPIRTAAAPEGA